MEGILKRLDRVVEFEFSDLATSTKMEQNVLQIYIIAWHKRANHARFQRKSHRRRNNAPGEFLIHESRECPSLSTHVMIS